MRTRIAAGVFAAAVIGSTLALAPSAQAQPSAATSCYGSAKSYSKPSGDRWYPNNGQTRLTTPGNCNDINIKPNQTTSIAVCFYPSSGGTECQKSFKTAPAGQWTVVATDVKPGTRFIFDFGSTTANTGVWAG
ncbi:hypothetical protein ACIQFZ_41425 [Streptomyces sp. NPDC093064]|uniref:hypothetical protein n=1 Tax=Streptomyces sp. NPDC093064 TaxID=3366020 RepID=UPI003810EA66